MKLEDGVGLARRAGTHFVASRAAAGSGVAWRTVVVGVLAFGSVGLRAADPGPGDELRELAAGAMAAGRLPSLSLAVSKDGELVYAEALGLADIENSVPATAQTVYRIGSVSKTLTAVAAMQLAERGRLDLDAPVQHYCPAFPDKEHPVTARLLLGHLGGIRHYDYGRFEEEFLSSRRYAGLTEALDVFKDDPLAAPPGTRYLYSSFGYVLLGCAIEGASDLPYERYLREEVLAPAGMVQTVLDVPESIVARRSRGYGSEKDGSWRNTVYVDLSDRFPAGGWLSTPSDLALFAQALLAGELLSTETLGRMWEPGRTAEGEVTGHGLGWRLGEDACEVYHGGSSVGGSAYLYLRPGSRTVVAFATNLELWDEPRHELATRFADVASGPGSCPSP
jgi:CubicO group peptidase (beta-lactamase class C family)